MYLGILPKVLINKYHSVLEFYRTRHILRTAITIVDLPQKTTGVMATSRHVPACQSHIKLIYISLIFSNPFQERTIRIGDFHWSGYYHSLCKSQHHLTSCTAS